MYEYNCKIVSVVDGDTVDVDIDLGFGIWMHKERIRVYGIDTPESRTSDQMEKIFGKLAAGVVEKFLPVGSTQTLVTIKDSAGKFGRVLGQFKIYDAVTDSQIMMGDWLIREKYAVEYKGQSKRAIANEHLRNYQVLVENLGTKILEGHSKTSFLTYINSRS